MGWLDKYQNGEEMSYYQHGQDFKPRTISQNGATIYNQKIGDIEDKYGMPRGMYHTLIEKESGFNPKAKSSMKAVGLSQITPGTAKLYGIDYNRLQSDTDYALEEGAKILVDKFKDKRVKGSWKDAVGYYNTGNEWFTEKGKQKALSHRPTYFNSIFSAIDNQSHPINPEYIQPIKPSITDETFIAQQRRDGGIVKDNLGYWNPKNFGKVVEIGSPNITMEGVDRELIGVSNTGDTKLLKPGNDYKFKGKKVTEYPIAKYGINELNNLLNFTNYNKSDKWLSKYK